MTSGTHNAPTPDVAAHDPPTQHPPIPGEPTGNLLPRPELPATFACASCGYDLRGFGPRDRCPECGTEVFVSLAARVVPAAALDPAWRREAHAAAAMALVSFALFFASMALPFLSVPAETGSRLEMLNSVTVCSAGGWALQWLSTMKICRTPRVDRRKWSAAVLMWVTRALVTAYTFVVPLMVVHYASVRDAVPQGLADTPITLGGPVCAAAYYLWIGAVFRSLGAPGPAAQSTLLAVIVPVVLVSVRSAYSLPGGFGIYATLPSYQHGLPAVVGWSARGLFEGSLPGTSLPVALSLCATYLHVRLLLTSRRQRAESAGRPPGGRAPHCAGAIPAEAS